MTIRSFAPRACVLSLIVAHGCSDGGAADGGVDAGGSTSGEPTSASTQTNPGSATSPGTMSAEGSADDSSGGASPTSDASGSEGSTTDAQTDGSSDGSDGSESTGTGTGLECGVDLECTGDTLWSRRFGNEDMTSSTEAITAVAAMPDGGAVIGGRVSGQAVFDDVGTVDMPPAAFVARLASDGAAQWVVALHAEDGVGIDDLGVDSAGNIVAFGGVLGDLDTGTDLWPGDSFDWSVFTLGLDPDGNQRFSARFDSNWTVGGQLAMGPDDGFAIVGYYEGGIDFGGNQLDAVGANADMFVAAFESDGSHRWSRRFGDSSYQYGHGIAIDDAGDIVVAGSDWGRIDFGDGLLPEHPGEAMVVAKLAASDGEGIWAQQFVGADGDALGDPRIATDGSRTFLGTFAGSGTYTTVDFGTGASSGDFHVAALDGDGIAIWSRSFSDDDFGGEGIVGIATSDDASVVIGGYIQTPTDFGDGVVHEAVGGDLFVAKYDADDGTTEWVRFEGDDDQGSGHQGTTDVAVADDGRVYAVGNFAGIVDFGDGDLVSGQGHGGWDGFVAALAP